GLVGIAWLHLRQLRWTWALTMSPLALLAWQLGANAGAAATIGIGLAAASQLRQHHQAIEAGGDLAERARARRGPSHTLEARRELERAAHSAGRRFVAWTPVGPAAYNPYAHGTDTEIADKALAGETYTEPHYQRQAQRFLGHAVRALRAAGLQVSPASLSAHL